MTNYAKHETGERADIARETLSYDPETGEIIRIKSDIRHPQLVGKSACFEVEDVWRMKYFSLTIMYRQYMAHRVAWLLYYGSWPTMLIGHEDGDGRNNRISNLRLVTNSQNAKNVKKVPSKSGHTGVRWHSIGKKWNARIKADGVEHSLGLYDDIEDAIAARKAAEVKYGFHPNHGKVR